MPPAWQPGGAASGDSIRRSVRRSLELAAERGCRSIAIPAIGAGIGGFSAQRCAEILIEEARAHLRAPSSLEEIRFVLFGEPMYRDLRDGARRGARARADGALRGGGPRR